MATRKYVSLNKLSIFLDKLKQTFATKTETDVSIATAKSEAETYINNKTSKLVSYESQTFTEEEKARARENIGAVSTSDISNAIVDVGVLPTSNIDDSVFYRLISATMTNNRQDLSAYWGCHCVNGLPSTGQPVTNTTQTYQNVYYNIQDGIAYGYIDSILSYATSVPIGWYSLSALAPYFGVEYGGVISDINNAPENNALILLLKCDLYSYKEGAWSSLGSADINSDVFMVTDEGIGWFAENVFVGDINKPKMLATTEYVDDKTKNINLSNLETKSDATAKLDEAKAYSRNNLSLAKTYSDTNLNTAKAYTDTKETSILAYTDNVIAQKTQVQIITWGVDD